MLGPGGRGLLLGLAVAAAAVMVARLMGWWGPRAGSRLFVPEELARYRGGPGDPGLYLALLGRVYDVSSGRRHYEPGAHYSGFAGRDASRAFVTGDYSEAGLVDDVSDLSFSEMLTLHNWLSFYEKNYVFVGQVIGRFYGKDGLPTPELKQVEATITKGLEANKQELKEKQKFPPCNAEWSATRGSRFWCSQESGGVSRDWIGVPRKLYKPGAKEPHCVCVRTTGPPSDHMPDSPPHRNRGDLDHPSLGEYTGCPPLAITCSFPL
uniref:Neuferricin n=2 Tax=Microcebus murinus TaxID=30608 RepID=A0A8B7HCQ3_MICMU|nr:neuferricin isoform X2 [Microcebus murinus]XP_012634650.1 neuferricin isoform X2 [Microcebus murinus]XP_012634651.1 neuferricin isoform X2 [Microcebus murinus]